MIEDIDRELFNKLDFCNSREKVEKLIQNIDDEELYKVIKDKYEQILEFNENEDVESIKRILYFAYRNFKDSKKKISVKETKMNYNDKDHSSDIKRNNYLNINKFDVVELKNGNRATIIDVKSNQRYFSEVVNFEGKTVGKYVIDKEDISKIIYSKK